MDVFVISPYRGEHGTDVCNDPVVPYRVQAASEYIAELTKQGFVCYSTVSAMHHISVDFDLPKSWEYWKKHCEIMIMHAYEVHVLCLDGWKESEGVQAEIEIAKMFSKKIKYINKTGDHPQ